MRICSLLPGATEVVAELGLSDDLVGISHECDYPATIQGKRILVKSSIHPEHLSSPDIDDLVQAAAASREPMYSLDEAGFAAAQPDLIITQDLCHVCAVTPTQLNQAIRLLSPKPQVLALNPSRLSDVIDDVQRIAAATNRVAAGQHFIEHLQERLTSIRNKTGAISHRPTVACLEWLDPVYAAGHWIPEMVEWAGGRDALAVAGEPSKIVSWSTVCASAPEIVVLMPCGFTIERTLSEMHRLTSRPGWNDLPAVRHDNVFVVDAAAYFSRPGPRLVQGVEILAAICHPSQFATQAPATVHQFRVSNRPRP